MEDEWRVATFEKAPLQIIDGDRGTNYPNQAEFSAAGHCLFLNAGNVTTTGFRFADCAFITAEKDAVLRKGKLVRNDVVLTTRGTVGNAAYFDDSIPFDHIRINSGMVILRAQTLALQSRYLYLFVRSSLFLAQVSALRTGSAQPQLPIRDISRVEIPIPPLGEQRAIAHILGTLDDKIELNRRMNETLEAMARALFKSWFVDFDPVRAKAEGRDPGLPKPLADLFPDSFEDSELGEIPKGWVAGRVDDEFDLTMGQSPPGDTYNELGEGMPFFQGRTDFGFRFPTRRVYCTAPTRLAKTGDTLISVRAPVGDINMASEDCVVGRGVAAARHKSGSRSYTYQFMRSLEDVFARFEGEGTVFGSIGKKDFHAIPCVVPPRGLVVEFERLMTPIDDSINNNDCESRTLAALRDTLLPKLISGELRIAVEERVAEAT
jgi:Restriction endonuclease S subunits